MINEAFLPIFYRIYNYVALFGGAGSGKCFAQGTRVVMFSGELKAVENVVVGDLLMGPDSTPRKVLSLSRGFGDLYTVHQTRNMDYTVNENHVLCLSKAVNCAKAPHRKQRYTSYPQDVEIPVKEYIKQSPRWKLNFYGYRTAVDFPEKEVTIDPYFLGVWLGDGTKSCIAITTEDSEIRNYVFDYAKRVGQDVSFVAQRGKADTHMIKGSHHPQHIREEWAKILSTFRGKSASWRGENSVSYVCNKTGFSRKMISIWQKQNDFAERVEYYRKNPEPYDINVIKKHIDNTPLFRLFTDYNLINNKHIPKDYLYNSRSVRLQVLAGIIDTDGSLAGNCYDIIQKNKQLAENIRYLANSLGFRCSLKECQKTCVNNGVAGIYYRTAISGNVQEIPVKVEHKKIKSYRKNKNPLLCGISVTPAGVGEYYGFEVDGDHKFFLEDFTVTHNSTAVGQALSLQTTTLEHRNVICMRKQATDCRDSCFAEMYNSIHQFGLPDLWNIRENPDMRMVNRINNNEIVFTGMDKVENIKSIKFKNGNATDFWYEEVTEETDVAVIRELDRRLRARGQKCRIILTFNPIYRSHWLYDYIYTELQGTDCFIHKSTYKDNRFLDDEYKAKLERFRLTDPYSYKVYALGEWGTTGQTVFDANKVSDRLIKLEKIQKENPVSRIEFSFEVDDKGVIQYDKPKMFYNTDGETTIYVAPNPKHPYVAAFDTAGEGSDYYACHVMDNITNEQVAVFHSQKNPDVCMPQIHGLLRMYNDALVAPEVNFDSYPVEKLKEWHYPHIYQRESPKDNYSEGYAPKLGFRTTVANRQAILSNLVEWSNEHMDCINDVATLHEMETFTRQAKKNKGIFWSAEQGTHDDLIMSAAILLQAKEQQTCEEVAEIKKLKGFYFPEEVEGLLELGKIDRKVANEYKKKSAFYKTFAKAKVRNRYAR